MIGKKYKLEQKNIKKFGFEQKNEERNLEVEDISYWITIQEFVYEFTIQYWITDWMKEKNYFIGFGAFWDGEEKVKKYS